MPTIDLAAPAPTRLPGPLALLDGLPRRVTLTLPELRHVASLAGGAPLPFDDAEAPGDAHPLEDRLGASPATAEDEAYAAALASLRDAEDSLDRRGLLTGAGADAGLVGAVGLLATPTTALDLDVTAAGLRARSWHRRAGDAVAALSTVDGLVFELAWFPVERWADELGRAAVLPADFPVAGSGVPAVLDLPFELADAAAEASRHGRADLIPVLVAQAEAPVVDGDGDPLPDPQAALAALTGEARGRLRALVADVSATQTSVVGVVSWTLLADGWHALRPRRVDHTQRVAVVAVDPADLAPELAPVLAVVGT
ncbi:hypothetical protein GCM10009623_21640 [Nocardioides aestuarii]|uniref:Uncharacterized protein n=1 Tax=Nocardioides aestuarii TaxID=252231 RepID=A0ABW4TN29_9ACTN